MKLVVTGALGHIGSRLIRELPTAFPGCEILLLDNLLTQRYCSLFELPSAGRYRFLETDITQVDLAPLFRGAHAVIHLAAITDAAGSFGKAEVVENNNFNGTRRVAEACAEAGTRLLTLSSTSVYGTQADLVDEDCTDEELKPQSPYATTKLKEEKLVQELAAAEGLKANVYRFGTIFGVSPGMRFHTAVNKFCWQAALGQPITVWSTALDQKRPYLDLGDACRAVELILKRDRFDGRVYNVLTENFTVRQIVDAIRGYIPDLEVKLVDSPIMNQLSYEVSCARFGAEGFVPRGDVKTAIGETLQRLRQARSF